MILWLFILLLVFAIFLIALSLIAAARFRKKVEKERQALLSGALPPIGKVLTETMVQDLPMPVRKWLRASGALGREIPRSICLEQQAQMRLKPDQTRWFQASADQVFTLNPPAFNWSVSVDMGFGIKALGRDEFADGRGKMKILLLGLIPVANAKDDERTDQASLQRFLAEMVWFPQAAASPYIKWREIDPRTAEATMTWGKTRGSGTFFFDENGNFGSFKALRYKDVSDEEPSEWIVSCLRTKLMDGIQIPSGCEVRWKTRDQDWTWLNLEVTNLVYT